MVKNRFEGLSLKESVEILRKITFVNKSTFPDLDTYLKERETYIKEKTSNQWTTLRFAYGEIYEDIKSATHTHELTENEFFSLIEILQEGL